MIGYWDRYLLTHRFTNEGEGGGGGGDGNGGGGGSGGSAGGTGGNGNNGGGQKPPWAEEFGETFDPEKAWGLISTLRGVEKTLKRDLGQANGKLKTYEDAGKTADEKTEQELATLRTENQRFKEEQRRSGLQAQVTDEARKAGAIYPEDIFRLLDEGLLQVADDGKITNLPRVVTDLKAARPQLFGSRNIDQNSHTNNGSNPPGSNDMNGLLRRAAGRG